MNRRLTLLRWVPIGLGISLIATACFLVDPLLGAIVLGIGGCFVAVVYVRVRRTPEGPDAELTEAGQLKAAWAFRSSQLPWDWFQALFGVYLMAILILSNGLDASTVMFGLGWTLISVESLVVEPRILAALNRDLGFTPADVGAGGYGLRASLSRRIRDWRRRKRVLVLFGAIACTGIATVSVWCLSNDREVPDVKGLSVADAKGELESYDLRADVVGHPSGEVCDQDPNPGRGKADKGDTVKIVAWYSCP
jgi:hypothetical protein